ncbi:hypothetical protein OH76DRAFT_700280 [Lentinus brumalis]|uniref:Uncharacterized protein n=1 Tax=Lentinus brumalis TaxID=2498619 RepID=A0A371CH24_9APHY|nr:hypothetical protein OH76DRAFT_700280 [Polyporus brumalis]
MLRSFARRHVEFVLIPGAVILVLLALPSSHLSGNICCCRASSNLEPVRRPPATVVKERR